MFEDQIIIGRFNASNPDIVLRGFGRRTNFINCLECDACNSTFWKLGEVVPTAVELNGINLLLAGRHEECGWRILRERFIVISRNVQVLSVGHGELERDRPKAPAVQRLPYWLRMI